MTVSGVHCCNYMVVNLLKLVRVRLDPKNFFKATAFQRGLEAYSPRKFWKTGLQDQLKLTLLARIIIIESNKLVRFWEDQ